MSAGNVLADIVTAWIRAVIWGLHSQCPSKHTRHLQILMTSLSKLDYAYTVDACNYKFNF